VTGERGDDLSIGATGSAMSDTRCLKQDDLVSTTPEFD
jgi:hypothetical protein